MPAVRRPWSARSGSSVARPPAEGSRPSCRTWHAMVDEIHSAQRRERYWVAERLLRNEHFVFRSYQDRAELRQFWEEMGLPDVMLAETRFVPYGRIWAPSPADE